MDMVKSFSVIFDTGSNYSFYSNKGYFVKNEDNISQEIPKAYQKALRFMDLGLSNIMSGVKVDV